MLTTKFMIKDDSDGFIDIYFFRKPVDTVKLEQTIGLVTAVKEGEWTLEDIAEAIKAIFPVEKIEQFESGQLNVYKIG